MNTTVWIVMQGEDCEGGFIEGVFANEADAINDISKRYPGWEEISPYERRIGCVSVWAEEWGVV